MMNLILAILAYKKIISEKEASLLSIYIGTCTIKQSYDETYNDVKNAFIFANKEHQ